MTEPTKEMVVVGLKGALTAFDELATEFVSKKRAANWEMINEGLMAAEKALREVQRGGE